MSQEDSTIDPAMVIVVLVVALVFSIIGNFILIHDAARAEALVEYLEKKL